MARAPVQTLRPTIRPDLKIIRLGTGGLNLSVPPDQLGENESPDMLNLVMPFGYLQVDSGVVPLGSKVVGQPQRVIEWIDRSHNTYHVLVTTRTVYTWSVGISDWIPVPEDVTTPATVNGLVTGTGSPTKSIAFSGSATWISGQLVALEMDNGHFLVGTTGGTTSPVVVTAVLAVGRTIANGKSILPLPTLNADGTLPLNYDIDPLQNWLMFVNGTDAPKRFDTATVITLPGTAAANIDTARYIARFHSVTVLGWVEELGLNYNYRIRRSATGDSGNWTTLDAGFDDLLDTGDDIHGLLVVNPYLVVFRRNSTIRASYYGVGQQVLYYDYGLTKLGSFGQKSSAANNLDSMMVSESGVYRYSGDYTVRDVGAKIFNYALGPLGNMLTGTRNRLFMFYVPEIDETWIFYTPADSSGVDPYRVLRYNHKNGAWFRREFSTLRFGGFGTFRAGGAQTWAQLGGPWSAQTWAWDSQAIQPNFNQLALCGTDNQVYIYDYVKSFTDNGTAIGWYIVTKDFLMPENWETLDGLVFYGQGQIDLIQLSVDHGMTWSTYATRISNNLNMGSLWSRIDIDRQITADFFRLRIIGGSSIGFKLSWIGFKHMVASER